MDQKPTTAPATRHENKRGARDAFVLIAMQFVSAAVGFAAFRQLGLTLPMAFVTGVTVFATMLAIHMVVRRNQTVAALEAEIAGLKGQIAAMGRGVPRAPGAPAIDQRMPARTPPSSSSAPPPAVPATMALRDTSVGAPAAGTSQVAEMPVSPRSADGRADRTSGTVPLQPGSRGVPSVVQQMRARPTTQDTVPDRTAPPPMPPVSAAQGTSQRAASSTATGSDDPSDELHASTRPRAARIPPPSLSEPPLLPAVQPAAVPPRAPSAPEKQVAPSPQASYDALAATPSGESRGAEQSPPERKLEQVSADPTMAPYWALRPGDMVAPRLPLPHVDPKAPSASAQLSASPPSAPRVVEVATSAPSPVPASNPNTDLDSMQKLIDQLAVQLRSPAAKTAALSDPSAPRTGTSDTASAALGESIAALRRTADTMRQTTEKPVSPADAASPYARLAIVAEAVAADRIDLYLDPILTLDERKTRHFEVSVRLRSDDGLEYATDDLAGAIAGTGLLARIDAAKLTRTAAVADRLTQRGTGASLFANLSGESLADNTFLDVFADTFVEQAQLCARLVLSFAQSDVRSFTDGHWEAVSTMAELGFRFALEHVTDLDMDFEDLRSGGFEFVKLDARVFLQGLPADNGEIVSSADICRHMSDIGLGLVVGGIVEERDLARVMGFGVLFGQGTLFGAPRAVSLDRTQRAA